MEPKVHVHLFARSLPLARRFYSAFFGSEPVKEKPGYIKFLPAFAPLNLAISEAPDVGAGGPVSHFGIQLATTKDVLAQLARVRGAGLPVRVEMGVDCCHANQDKFWVCDPDGNEWEVYRLNHDVEAEGASAAAASLATAPIVAPAAASSVAVAVAVAPACCVPRSAEPGRDESGCSDRS